MMVYKLQKMDDEGNWRDTGEMVDSSEVDAFIGGADAIYLEEEDVYFFVGPEDEEDYQLVPSSVIGH